MAFLIRGIFNTWFSTRASKPSRVLLSDDFVRFSRSGGRARGSGAGAGARAGGMLIIYKKPHCKTVLYLLLASNNKC